MNLLADSALVHEVAINAGLGDASGRLLDEIDRLRWENAELRSAIERHKNTHDTKRDRRLYLMVGRLDTAKEKPPE